VIRLFFECGTPTGVQDREGQTILYRLVDSIHYEYQQDKSLTLLAGLLELGVDPNVRDESGGTVLHYLAKKASSRLPPTKTFVWKAFDILLRHGGEPTVQDKVAMSPLDYLTDLRSFASWPESLARREVRPFTATAIFLLIQSMVRSGL